MIVIAHRANGFGFKENSADGVGACLDAGIIPEVDVWNWEHVSHGPPDADALKLKTLLARNKLSRVLVHDKGRSEFKAIGIWPTGILTLAEADEPGDLFCHDVDGFVVTDTYEWLTPDGVGACQAEGQKVLAAGPNIFRHNERRWLELAAIGVDGILTDAPAECVKFLEEIGA